MPLKALGAVWGNGASNTQGPDNVLLYAPSGASLRIVPPLTTRQMKYSLSCSAPMPTDVIGAAIMVANSPRGKLSSGAEHLAAL